MSLNRLPVLFVIIVCLRCSMHAQTPLFVGTTNNETYLINGSNFVSGLAVLGFTTTMTTNGVGVTSTNTGTVIVTNGATWNNTDAIIVGGGGPGHLIINGSSVTNQLSSTVGQSGGGQYFPGTAIIDNGSRWALNQRLTIGGSVVVNDGTLVNKDNVFVGLQSNTPGSITINNGGNWISSAGIFIGGLSAGTLTVNGGNVSDVTGKVSFGEATINGGSWSNSGSLAIGGNYGTARMTIKGGGSVYAGGGVVIGPNSAFQAELNIGSVGSNDVAGTVNTPSIFINSGSLNLNQANTSTISANISDSGNGHVNQNGTGLTILTGNNSGYSGTTTISAGTLQFGDGNNSQSLPFNGPIVNNSTLISMPSGSSTFEMTKTISGTGNLIQSGTGTTILSGSNTYTGTTLVNAGNLFVNGTHTGGDIYQINAGGTFGGTGSTTSQVEIQSGGIITPGNGLVPGKLTVGQFKLNTGGVLNILINNSSTSVLSIRGNAYLGGALRFISSGKLYSPSYVFITTGGVVANSFAFIAGLPTGYQLVYGINSVFLLENSNPDAPANSMASISDTVKNYPDFTQFAINRNQSNVAAVFNSFTKTLTSDQQAVLTTLTALDPSEIQQAFEASMPSFYQQLATVALNTAQTLNNGLLQNIRNMRLSEEEGFFSSMFSDQNRIQEGEGDRSENVLRSLPDRHWSMFSDAHGIAGKVSAANMLPSYNSAEGGVTAGLNYRWNQNIVSGFYAGYDENFNKFGSGLEEGSFLHNKSVRMGGFGSWWQRDNQGQPIGYYGTAIAGLAYNNYQASRVIQFPRLERTAQSSPCATQVDSTLSGGYDLKKGAFSFGPTATIQYAHFDVNNLNETGAQSLNFRSSGWNTESLQSSLGAHVAYKWIPRSTQKHIVVFPQFNLNWQHEFMQNPYAINGTLGGSGPTFSNWSPTPSRDTISSGVGVTVDFANRLNASLFYTFVVGNSYQIQSVTVSTEFKF